MRCSNCGYYSFDHVSVCKKCSTDLSTVRQELGFVEVKAPLPFSLDVLLKEMEGDAGPLATDLKPKEETSDEIEMLEPAADSELQLPDLPDLAEQDDGGIVLEDDLLGGTTFEGDGFQKTIDLPPQGAVSRESEPEIEFDLDESDFSLELDDSGQPEFQLDLDDSGIELDLADISTGMDSKLELDLADMGTGLDSEPDSKEEAPGIELDLEDLDSGQPLAGDFDIRFDLEDSAGSPPELGDNDIQLDLGDLEDSAAGRPKPGPDDSGIQLELRESDVDFQLDLSDSGLGLQVDEEPGIEFNPDTMDISPAPVTELQTVPETVEAVLSEMPQVTPKPQAKEEEFSFDLDLGEGELDLQFDSDDSGEEPGPGLSKTDTDEEPGQGDTGRELDVDVSDLDFDLNLEDDADMEPVPPAGPVPTGLGPAGLGPEGLAAPESSYEDDLDFDLNLDLEESDFQLDLSETEEKAATEEMSAFSPGSEATGSKPDTISRTSAPEPGIGDSDMEISFDESDLNIAGDIDLAMAPYLEEADSGIDPKLEADDPKLDGDPDIEFNLDEPDLDYGSKSQPKLSSPVGPLPTGLEPDPPMDGIDGIDGPATAGKSQMTDALDAVDSFEGLDTLFDPNEGVPENAPPAKGDGLRFQENGLPDLGMDFLDMTSESMPAHFGAPPPDAPPPFEGVLEPSIEISDEDLENLSFDFELEEIDERPASIAAPKAGDQARPEAKDQASPEFLEFEFGEDTVTSADPADDLVLDISDEELDRLLTEFEEEKTGKAKDTGKKIEEKT